MQSHGGLGAPSPPALDHGFQTALYAITALLIFGVVLVATLVRPPRVPAERVESPEHALEEAA